MAPTGLTDYYLSYSSSYVLYCRHYAKGAAADCAYGTTIQTQPSAPFGTGSS